MMRERIIRLHVDDAAMEFDNDAQILSFQYAVGRMATYGMRSGQNNGLEHVEMSIDGDRVIAGAFYPPTAFSQGHAPFVALGTALEAFTTAQPQLVQAIPDETGGYTYKR